MVYGTAGITFPSALIEARGDESDEVRAAAIRALARYGPDLDSQIPTLFAMIETEKGDVRTACIGPLQTAWPTPALTPNLIELLKSRDHVIRYNAALLLGRIGPEASAAIPGLIAVLNEPFNAAHFPDPAREAARALGQMGPGNAAIMALVNVIAPEKIDRCLKAFETLENGGPLAPEVPARKALRIMSAIEALGEIGPPAVDAVPALLAAYQKALAAHHSMAGKTIPEALARIAPGSAQAKDAVAGLIVALEPRYYATERAAAIGALAHFGNDAAVAIPALKALQNRTTRSPAPEAAHPGALPNQKAIDEIGEYRVGNAVEQTIAAIEAATKSNAGAMQERAKP
jgi:HEAT repeat protein